MASSDSRAEMELKLRQGAGRILGKLLRERGHNESSLARELGVAPTSVNRWTSSSSRPPSLARIQQLAEILDSPDLRRIAEQIIELYGAGPMPGLTQTQAEQLRSISRELERLVGEVQRIVGE